LVAAVLSKKFYDAEHDRGDLKPPGVSYCVNLVKVLRVLVELM